MLDSTFPLINKSKNSSVAAKVWVADTFYSRAKGLLGKTHLPQQETLWIHSCSSIHTFFMKFPIDVVFVDKNLKVKSIRTHVRPGRLLFPVLGADSVFEFAAGSLDIENIQQGDQLYVGT